MTPAAKQTPEVESPLTLIRNAARIVRCVEYAAHDRMGIPWWQHVDMEDSTKYFVTAGTLRDIDRHLTAAAEKLGTWSVNREIADSLGRAMHLLAAAPAVWQLSGGKLGDGSTQRVPVQPTDRLLTESQHVTLAGLLMHALGSISKTDDAEATAGAQ